MAASCKTYALTANVPVKILSAASSLLGTRNVYLASTNSQFFFGFSNTITTTTDSFPYLTVGGGGSINDALRGNPLNLLGEVWAVNDEDCIVRVLIV